MLLLLRPNTLSFVGTRGSGRAPRAGVTTPTPRLVVNASRPRGTVR